MNKTETTGAGQSDRPSKQRPFARLMGAGWDSPEAACAAKLADIMGQPPRRRRKYTVRITNSMKVQLAETAARIGASQSAIVYRAVKNMLDFCNEEMDGLASGKA